MCYSFLHEILTKTVYFIDLYNNLQFPPKNGALFTKTSVDEYIGDARLNTSMSISDGLGTSTCRQKMEAARPIKEGLDEEVFIFRLIRRF